jgi:hypothetical protein
LLAGEQEVQLGDLWRGERVWRGGTGNIRKSLVETAGVILVVEGGGIVGLNWAGNDGLVRTLAVLLALVLQRLGTVPGLPPTVGVKDVEDTVKEVPVR